MDTTGTTTTARDTIAAVASPPGRGVRAVVRASGPGARAAAARLLGARPSRRGAWCARASGCGLAAPLPLVALWLECNASFTGEDSLEFTCVGSPVVAESLVDAVLEAARLEGFAARRARAGEFALRAHLAGRLSVDAAEGVAARIAATSDAELVAADEVARGGYGARAAALAARTAEALALVEAGIDFTDQEDVVAIEPAALAARVRQIASEALALRGDDPGASSRAVPTIVLAGAPNAGKSALFNALIGRARVVSSPERGTTRDAIRARLTLGGSIEAELVDLAGLEDGSAGLEDGSAAPGTRFGPAMQRQAAQWIARADVVLRCTPPGAHRVESPPSVRGARQVEVATMGDLRAAAGAPAPADAIEVSARTGQGIDLLRRHLGALVRSDHALRGACLAAVLPRHAEALARAAAMLAEVNTHAARAAQNRPLREPEVVASLLRSALDALGEVAAPIHPDDVLGLVFSRFCIGK